MSIKFTIKNRTENAKKEGDTFVRYSGKAEPYTQSTEREVREVGVDGGGNPKLVFTTGLNLDKVHLYRWYTEEEQAEVKKQIEEFLPKLAKAFGGMEVLDETNQFFWKKKREVNRLVLTQDCEKILFNTDNPTHALLYFGIMAGAFMEIVAPNREWAEGNGIIHYLALETDQDFEGEDDITKAEAMASLMELKDNPEALFILAWCLQYDTTSFGAYTKAISHRNLLSYHIQFIEGKLPLKGRNKKKNFPKAFMEYAERWKGQQTRPKLFTEAYVKAGEYYSFINQKEKKYVTSDGTTLGNTITEAVENLHKSKFQSDYERLRDLIETKWKE